MTTRTRKKRPTVARPVQAPAVRKDAAPLLRRRSFTWAALAFLVIAIAVIAAVLRGNNDPVATPATGLPATTDYHSLAVNPTNSQQILLGTHSGLFSSDDGGARWHLQALAGQDAMSLARPGGARLWMAGHDVMAKSADGGRSWQSVRPAGLPDYDVHGFAADPKGGTLYAAIAGRGLYRSTNGGASFTVVSTEVGGSVMALAVRPDGSILAGDMQQGLLESRDGGKTWRVVVRAQLRGLAVNPANPRRILAAGPGVLLSTNGGKSWTQPLKLEQGAGPVAWSASNPDVAYVVGFDRSLYKTTDGGSTWRAAAAGGE